MRDVSARLLENERIGPRLCLLRLEAPEIAARALPGQFVAVRAAEGFFPLLRRPMSICAVEDSSLLLLVKVVGVGTRLLYEAEPGAHLHLLGPLGRPFEVEGDFEVAVLFGGGVGVAPLVFLERELRRRGRRVCTLLGARTASELVLRHLKDPFVATEDGSAGLRGTVLDLWRIRLQGHIRGRMKWFSCGPLAMLRALAWESQAGGWEHEVALETPMGCGFGVCQGCVVPLRGPRPRYGLACMEGPVFKAQEVNWDALGL
ncbi:MAG: dihydroorotate dehydrogenase electron transfer subunit [Bacteroidetes bacterium]|nr:dihydroorotate dehydrogenase electron transfer subunit [Rhodothermia bacterium]MCX7906528.1 dihydroorotate dehydrogenase electron transfer subunit [Bacteroidota bacterium]MDW8284939.1 dihydroorotate dehydrogenase electron transfer subunit [Bacteroidota bacterium]